MGDSEQSSYSRFLSRKRIFHLKVHKVIGRGQGLGHNSSLLTAASQILGILTTTKWILVGASLRAPAARPPHARCSLQRKREDRFKPMPRTTSRCTAPSPRRRRPTAGPEGAVDGESGATHTGAGSDGWCGSVLLRRAV